MNKKGLLIDVEKKEFRPVEYDGLEDMYGLLGCSTIDCITLGERMGVRLVCVVDDEGLLKERTKGFLIDGSGQPIMGNGLLVAENEEGETVGLGPEDVRMETWFKFIEYDDHKQVPVPPIQVISWEDEDDAFET